MDCPDDGHEELAESTSAAADDDDYSPVDVASKA